MAMLAIVWTVWSTINFASDSIQFQKQIAFLKLARARATKVDININVALTGYNAFGVQQSVSVQSYSKYFSFKFGKWFQNFRQKIWSTRNKHIAMKFILGKHSFYFIRKRSRFQLIDKIILIICSFEKFESGEYPTAAEMTAMRERGLLLELREELRIKKRTIKWIRRSRWYGNPIVNFVQFIPWKRCCKLTRVFVTLNMYLNIM